MVNYDAFFALLRILSLNRMDTLTKMCSTSDLLGVIDMTFILYIQNKFISVLFPPLMVKRCVRWGSVYVCVRFFLYA